MKPLAPAEAAAVARRLDRLEHVLERAVRLPVIGHRVGLDSVVGLVPVAGDVLGGTVGLYLIWEARRLGLPRSKLAAMAANVALDTTLGAVPVVGDLFDFVFRANTRNMKLIRRELAKQDGGG